MIDALIDQLEFLGSVGLDILDCRGWGYDGADTIGFKDKGWLSQVTRINPKALSPHWKSYILNLAFVRAYQRNNIHLRLFSALKK